MGSLERRLYRLLLGLLPGDLRDRFGADMTELLRDRLEEAGDRPGDRLRIWWAATKDVAVHAAAERMKWTTTRGRGRGSSRTRGTSEGSIMVSELTQDLRIAGRGLVRSPGFALTALLTLALGIGANTAVFSVVNAVLLRPLPYAEPDRLVSVWPEANFNVHMVERVEREVPALAAVSGIAPWEFSLTGDGDPVRVTGAQVSPGHFELLGVAPMLGRSFRDEEAHPDADDVVILSHGLWLRRYGGDVGVLGRQIPVSGADSERRRVVGVMPAGFLPPGGEDVQLWVPLHTEPGLSLAQDPTWFVNRRVARLARGVTVEQASSQLRAVAERMREEAPTLGNLSEETVRVAEVRPLREAGVSDVRSTLWILMGAVGVVLLVACANLANLLLARGEGRERELAVRRALGATRGRLVRQLLTESLVLGVLGGGIGVAVAAWGVRLLSGLAPAELPRMSDVRVDAWVLAFGLLASVASALVFGLAPALRAAGRDLERNLRGSRSGAGRSARTGLSRTLVGVQVALAVVLATGAGLMVRSLAELYAVDPGFRPDGLLVMRASPATASYGPADPILGYYDGVLERVRALPDVEAASAIHLLPLTFGNWGFPVMPEGREPDPSAPPPVANFRAVRSGYFETMGIPLLQGRAITAADGADDAPVMVVNRAFAETHWPGESAVGKEVQIFPPGGVRYRVVGVAGDVRQFSLDLRATEEMYVPHTQWARVSSFWLLVRTRGEPLDAAAAVQDAVWTVDPDVPLSDVNTMDAVVRASAGDTRFVALLLGAFGGLALLLGVVGVYGVTSYSVARRVPEFGLRMALGAPRASVQGSAVGHGMAPAALGLGAGLVLAWAGAGVMDDLVYGVPSRDPLTLGAVAVVLAGSALLATWSPARRASRVDPAEVLRQE